MTNFVPFADPHTSPEAKRHAEEVLRAAGVEEISDETEDEYRKRVMAGYKAALHSMSTVYGHLSTHC